MEGSTMLHRLRIGALAVALAGVPVLSSIPFTAYATPSSSTKGTAATYPTADAATAALIDALQRDDTPALRAILGPGSDALITSGDPVADHEARAHFVAAYQKKHTLSATGPDQVTLVVGDNDFPLPLPIIRTDGTWHFDSVQGAQDLVDRRIGRNEIAAIRVALSYYDAQKLFFETSNAAGSGEYAQRIVSAPGKHDGLYWPTAEGDEPSPLAPLVQQAQDEGYPGERAAGKPIPYQGYYFRILKSQGPAAPGGRMDYVVNGRMTKGFALVAWPARYGASGIMTFIINSDGIVFQKNLGPRTTAIVADMKAYDPDLSWTRVDVVP